MEQKNKGTTTTYTKNFFYFWCDWENENMDPFDLFVDSQTLIVVAATWLTQETNQNNDEVTSPWIENMDNVVLLKWTYAQKILYLMFTDQQTSLINDLKFDLHFHTTLNFFYKQLGSGLSPDSCLYFKAFGVQSCLMVA